MPVGAYRERLYENQEATVWTRGALTVPMTRHRTLIRLSAALAGVALVWACGGDSPTVPPTPEPARPATVTVSPATADLTALGATVQPTAEVRDQNARVMAGATVTWSSGDTSVATVDASGLVTAVGNGAARITASAGNASGSAVVTVTQSVATVEVSPSAADLAALGATVQLTAEALDANGHAVAEAEFSWESSDNSVATVDASGLVTGVAEGTATITASAGSASGSAVVSVMQPVATVEVSPSAETIALGSTLQLTAVEFDENGDAVESVQFSWESSDVAIATVDASGLVTGVAVGAATITASAGSRQGTAEITVMDLERAALVALYEATDGPSWVDAENWLTDAPLGDWFGVDTDDSGRVVSLAMSYYDRQLDQWTSNGLSGPIPTELGDLTSLEYLQFFNNRLSGPIPPELGNLAGLEILYLGRNDLTGPIPPELGRLADLELLSLGGNDLTGPIPPELGDLTDLESLNLGGNDLTGPIPPELGELANLTLLSLSSNSLTGPIPPELGRFADLELLSLGGNDLTGPIPPELGDLADLRYLNLGPNSLTGPIPPELGRLANLESLYLYYNDLTGSIPEIFLEIEALEQFRFERNVDLCAPGTIDFVTWLEGIEDTSGPYCNESDTDVLELLYETSGGPDWTNSTGWLETPALDEWYGVTADGLGRVVTLDLSRNGLAGQLPGNLNELAGMTELRIVDNPDLSGRLPLSLADLSLRALHYAGTELCTPVYKFFRDWLSAIPSHEGTGVECGLLPDREFLEALYDATGGPDWTHNENWLTDTPLGDWYGVEVDGHGRVVGLDFTRNRLTGRIPRELGSLANLRSLWLYRDDLTGPIPPELGNLANLESLYLHGNDLTGPIPPELGNLANLESLYLHENDLTGPIPPELGNLAGLEILYLGRNDLTGPIPPELGGLADLRGLNLATNRLTGRIPPELGGLADLEYLYLGENELAGPVPPEFGGLMSLRNLALQTNADMSGALPASLTNLAALETFQTSGTALCAPSDAGFLEWLQGVPNRRVALCESEPAAAYLVQAVQSREFPVPLVGGEEALLRVFVTASRDNDERLPPVRASFYLSGTLVHVADIPGRPGPIPTDVDEGSLATSANAVVPADVVLPGLEMVVEVDPDGTLEPALGVARRIPATGRAAIDVQAMPLFDLTVVPFLWTAEPDLAVLESVEGMAADPEGHELLELTHTLLPVGGLEVTGPQTRGQFEQRCIRPDRPDAGDPGHGRRDRVLDGHDVGKLYWP